MLDPEFEVGCQAHYSFVSCDVPNMDWFGGCEQRYVIPSEKIVQRAAKLERHLWSARSSI